MPIEIDRKYTTAEAAALLGVGEETVRARASAGLLESAVVNRVRVIPGRALLEWRRTSRRVLKPAVPVANPVPANLPDRKSKPQRRRRG